MTTSETRVTVNIPSAEKWELDNDGTYTVKIEFEKEEYNRLRIELDSIPDYVSGIKAEHNGIRLVARDITNIVSSFLTFIAAPTAKTSSKMRT